MKRLTTLSIIASVLAVAACATPVSPEKLAAADYGPPPPANYEELIKARFNEILVDPTSPIYEIDKPRKGYTRPYEMYGTQEAFGWVVCGTVNSKNRMGGYAGRSPFFVLFRGEYMAEFITGESRGASALNDDIRRACRRYVS